MSVLLAYIDSSACKNSVRVETKQSGRFIEWLMLTHMYLQLYYRYGISSICHIVMVQILKLGRDIISG